MRHREAKREHRRRLHLEEEAAAERVRTAFLKFAHPLIGSTRRLESARFGLQFAELIWNAVALDADEGTTKRSEAVLAAAADLKGADATDLRAHLGTLLEARIDLLAEYPDVIEVVRVSETSGEFAVDLRVWAHPGALIANGPRRGAAVPGTGLPSVPQGPPDGPPAAVDRPPQPS